MTAQTVKIDNGKSKTFNNNLTWETLTEKLNDMSDCVDTLNEELAEAYLFFDGEKPVSVYSMTAEEYVQLPRSVRL